MSLMAKFLNYHTNPLQKRSLFRWMVNTELARTRRQEREAGKQVGTNSTSSTKKRSAATHGGTGHEKKARKTAPSAPSASSSLSAPSAASTPPPRTDKGTEDVSTQFHKTPAARRQASYTGLMEHEIISASEMQNQIAPEARGGTRNIPWDKFS